MKKLRIANYELRIVILFVVISTILSACSYSFTGSSVPPHLKTVAIPLFNDESGFGEPNLREQFTNEMIKRVQDDNSLQIAEKDVADATLECSIKSVKDEPAVVNPGETVSKRKVTMSVSAIFYDKTLKKKMWEKTFSNWGNYETSSGIAQRTEGITEARDKIIESILLETVSGW